MIFFLIFTIYLFCYFIFFFFNDTATTEIYTLSLHDALPICWFASWRPAGATRRTFTPRRRFPAPAGSPRAWLRSEEHTSELQSRLHLVCRLLLEKKKKKYINTVKHYKRLKHILS